MKLIQKFLFCTTVAIALLLIGCSASDIDSKTVEIEAFNVSVPTEWTTLSTETIYSWQSPDEEATIVFWPTTEFSPALGKTPYFDNDFVEDTFSLRYDQRTYGKDDYTADRKSVTLKGLEEATLARFNGTFKDELYDIDAYELKAPYKNEYDEILSHHYLQVVMFTKTNGANSKKYHSLFNQLIKKVTVDSNKYKEY